MFVCVYRDEERKELTEKKKQRGHVLEEDNSLFILTINPPSDTENKHKALAPAINIRSPDVLRVT